MRIPISLALIFLCALAAFSQVPLATGIQILKAEDARRYDSVLENLMQSPNADVRERAALAAGRIGDEKALPPLIALLEKDSSTEVRAMAAFAIGEIESIAGADAVIAGLKREVATKPLNERADPQARLVEAAGKVAAANSKDPKAKDLGAAILDVLRQEPKDRTTILLALTAALRARPAGGSTVVAGYISHADPRVRADALNTLGRLRSDVRTGDIRDLLGRDPDATVRANAARVLGAAGDKNSLEALVNAATKDGDVRVRVSAIRALGSLKDPAAVSQLIAHGGALLSQMRNQGLPKPGVKPPANPVEINELLEMVTSLAAILPNTENDRAVSFIDEFRMADGFVSPESEIALAKIAPKAYTAAYVPPDYGYRDYHMVIARARGLATIAETKNPELIADAGEKLTGWTASMAKGVRPAYQKKMLIAMPDLTTALAALAPDNIDEILRGQMKNDDVFIRAAAAGALADRPSTPANLAALNSAFSMAFVKDKHDNDAIFAIMDALVKLDKKGAVGSLLTALDHPDYLVRSRAYNLLDDAQLKKDFPGIDAAFDKMKSKHTDEVRPYSPAFGTKLGQVLNTDIDYRRALSRKNGSIRAVLTTEKGTFTIAFNPEEAPLTVDNWVKLARSGYFNGLEVHRVVPNFVMQDGDPRGDGNGGPGWSIRCEVNMLPYDRGAVGMALSGKDTGGSQWFVTHSPQPHLDGGYTVFGHITERDMKVVDSIVRGD
ncbi:MAG TPA: HEAT repeat domain-containing protein, partial [Pyrinomonadaceae bacterium]|nr:HEAT repeat domain-containing protein [Pyrinomonadaceae bacterium]